MDRLLILGAPVFQIPVVEKAKELGCYVGIVDINSDAPAAPYADEAFAASIRDIDAVIDIAKSFRPTGIMSGACDTSVVAAAYACDELQLAGNTIDTAIKATDKVRMLEAFAANKVAHPKYQVVSKDELDTFVLRIPLPVISKPTDSAGGRGVFLVRDSSELKDAILYSSNSGLSGDVLIEEYLEGPEVSVEVLVADGAPHVLQITDKMTSGAPNFYETGHLQPSTLPYQTKREIEDMAGKAALAVGISNGPAHVEIKVTDAGAKLIELGARLGGDCITSYLIDTSLSGIDMTKAAIQMALGKTPNVSSYSNSGKYSCVRFIPSQNGLIREIRGFERVSNMPEIVSAMVMGVVGKEYTAATDDSSRFGYVVAQGDSADEAVSVCSKALDLIDFVLD